MMRLAEVNAASYSGKLGFPSLVRASARSSPPVSATSGGLTPRDPGTARTHSPASYPWIRKAASRADAVPRSTARPPPAGPFEQAQRRSDPPLGLASTPAHPPPRDEPSWKQVVPYTHHTPNDAGRPSRTDERVAEGVQSRLHDVSAAGTAQTPKRGQDSRNPPSTTAATLPEAQGPDGGRGRRTCACRS